MMVVGLSHIAAQMGVSMRTAKRLAKTGAVPMQLVDRQRRATPQAIATFRVSREAIPTWESEGGSLRRVTPSHDDQTIEETSDV